MALKAAPDVGLARLRAARALVLFLDYDGTLVPFRPTPEEASPDAELLALLRALSARPRTEVHVVSGRPPAVLDAWLGALPIGLHAEHGLWSRPRAGVEWRARAAPDLSWQAAVRATCREMVAATPGALVEEKTAGLAWHYRMVEPDLGEARAAELTARLQGLLRGGPAEILLGDKVVEVRPRGVHKGVLVGPIAAAAPPGHVLVGIGDDQTDEDLFAALPPDAVAIHVGPEPSRAPLHLPGVAEVRALLWDLLTASSRG